jgi:hypothetical protein
VFGSCGNKVFDQLSVCWVRGSGNYNRKKRYSRLSGGLCCCVSFWFWREISIFFVVAGNFDYDRKKKTQSSVGGKLAVFLLWRKIFIMTGKKKDTLRPEKKRYSRLWRETSILL